MFWNHFQVSYRSVRKKFCEPCEKHPFSQIFLTFWWRLFKKVQFCRLLFIFITIWHIQYFFTCVFFPLVEVVDSFSSNSYLFLFIEIKWYSMMIEKYKLTIRISRICNNERRWNIWIFSIEDSRTYEFFQTK